MSAFECGGAQYRANQVATVGALSASSVGTALTPPASANTKGAWTELTSSCPIDADGFLLALHAGDTAQTTYLVDIGVGAGGSEVALIENVMFHVYEGVTGYGVEYYVPLSVAAGQRIAGRFQAKTTAGDGVRVILHLGTGTVYSALRMLRAATFGADTSDTSGVFLDGGASTHTKGAWAELTASTATSIESLLICSGLTNTTTTAANFLFDIGVGPGGSEAVVIGDLYLRETAAAGAASAPGDQFLPQSRFMPLSIPAGSRIAARTQSSTNDVNDRGFDIVVIGFGP